MSAPRYRRRAPPISTPDAHGTPGPLTQEGHAVFAVGYDANTVNVLTWGNSHRGTWSWWDACVEEAYAILPPEGSDAKFAPGFNLAQLQVDLSLLGTVPHAAVS